MSLEPRVSVITIFLNEERFLQDAIDSLRAQTTDRWELLLVDDGSTDGSPEIARQAARQDPERIRYLAHPGNANRGKSVSRNLGIEAARAPYLTFLDGDDVFLPEKVERQAALLDQHDVAMVYGPTLYWFDWPGAPAGDQTNFMGKLGTAPDRVYPPPELLKMYLRDSGTVPCICGLTVRKSVAREIGAFDERIQYMYEDQVFLAKVCIRYPVFVESGCWDQYRQHPRSTSQQAIATGEYHPSRPNPSHAAYLQWLEGHLETVPSPDPELAALVRERVFPYRHPRLHAAREWSRRIRRAIRRRLRGRPQSPP